MNESKFEKLLERIFRCRRTAEISLQTEFAEYNFFETLDRVFARKIAEYYFRRSPCNYK